MSLFKKKSSEFDEQDSQGSGTSKGSLLVLLVLLAGFAYLYFFTSLIVPHEPSVTAPAVSTEVKQSMPPKPADLPANPATGDAAKPAESQPAVPPAPATATPTASTAASPASVKPAAPVAVAPVAAKPTAPPASAKPAVPVPAPQAAAKPATPPQLAAAPKKEAVVPLKKDEPKPAKAVARKPAQAVQPKETKTVKAPVPAQLAATKKPASYAIFAGEFPAGEEAAAAEAKLARLGIKPVTRQETNKSRSMHRLFFGAYSDYDVYAAELDKLRQSAKGAFGVEKDGKYYLYAGSFSSKERVENEKKALAAKGITLQSQLVILPLSTVKLTAGRFTAKGEADKAAARMKSAGLAGKVDPLGR